MKRKLKVALDATLQDHNQGVGVALIGLAKALSELSEGDDYYFLVQSGNSEWIRPYIGARCSIVEVSAPRRSKVRNFVQKIGLAKRVWERLSPFAGKNGSALKVSDGTIEKLGVDVIHFPTQLGFLTRIPSIYQPWDLQHIHLPQFFTRREWHTREIAYRRLCEQASIVCVQTHWGKRDLISHYGIPPSKVEVVPWASVLPAYPEPSREELKSIEERLRLPGKFVYYPAATWPHKNHRLLIRAANILKYQYNVDIEFICTGKQTSELNALKRYAEQYGVSNQFRFLGFVNSIELKCIYKVATALVFPSKFEGWGLPIIEAFESGVPVVCSKSAVLPEVAGGAAILIDGEDHGQFADAILRLCNDPNLRCELGERGKKRASEFSFEKTARMMRALYRRAAQYPLTDDDKACLDVVLQTSADEPARLYHDIGREHILYD